MIDTAVIVVSWNGLQWLKDCFDALKKQTYSNFKIIFVDNGSTDNSADFIKNNYSEISIVIELKKNIGFTGGNNIAFKYILQNMNSVENFILLNNDTIVDKNWLYEMIKVKNQFNVDMVSSMAIFEGNTTVQTIGSSYHWNIFGKKDTGVSEGYGDSVGKYSEIEPFEIFCPSAVSALYSRKLIEKVGIFDERFFAYYEDYDLGWRARNSGYKCMFSPKSKLIHFHSRTSGGSKSPLKIFLIRRNGMLTALKNGNFIQKLFFFLFDIFFVLKNLSNNIKSKNKLNNIKKLYFFIMPYIYINTKVEKVLHLFYEF